MWEGQKTMHLNMTVMVVLEVLQLCNYGDRF